MLTSYMKMVGWYTSGYRHCRDSVAIFNASLTKVNSTAWFSCVLKRTRKNAIAIHS